MMAFLKITEKSEYSFLLESIMDGEHVARYSFIGSGESGISGPIHEQ